MISASRLARLIGSFPVIFFNFAFNRAIFSSNGIHSFLR